MSQKKYKKRKHSATVNAKRQAEQERIADEKDRARKRMDPTARTLLLVDLVFKHQRYLVEGIEKIQKEQSDA